jgi:hypothetical protein
MAAKSGLKPFETDSLPPCDVWIMVEGHERNERFEWERTRAICFNVAKFGNSDPKKIKNPQDFWPLPWDKKQGKPDGKKILEHHARMIAIRKQFEK